MAKFVDWWTDRLSWALLRKKITKASRKSWDSLWFELPPPPPKKKKKKKEEEEEEKKKKRKKKAGSNY